MLRSNINLLNYVILTFIAARILPIAKKITRMCFIHITKNRGTFNVINMRGCKSYFYCKSYLWIFHIHESITENYGRPKENDNIVVIVFNIDQIKELQTKPFYIAIMRTS